MWLKLTVGTRPSRAAMLTWPAVIAGTGLAGWIGTSSGLDVPTRLAAAAALGLTGLAILPSAERRMLFERFRGTFLP